MAMPKNEGIQKDASDKYKQYQKRGRDDLFIFQKTEKNRVLNINSSCNCSDHFSQLWLWF